MCFSTLKDYVNRTKDIRTISNESRLFASTKKPHKGVTTSTLARWLKDVLHDAGIDPSIYTAHSYRSASTSMAFAHGVTLQEIIKTANWSSANTFTKFYHKTIDNNMAFGRTILSQSM